MSYKQSNSNLIKFTFFLAIFAWQNSIAQTAYNYLGTFSSNGRPNNLVSPSDIITSQLMTRVRQSFPEYYPVPRYNPQYLTGTPSDLRIEATADVWVTFVDEGAGNRNSLAFYTYNLANPPLTKPSTLTIVFPNLSLEGNVLRAGEKVYLGSFPAGTGIGFALIADGFQNGRVSSSATIYYSNPNFNPERRSRDRQHSVMLNDIFGVNIIGFEDLDRSTSATDNDFNDLIFYATANPITICTTCNPTVGGGGGGISTGNNGGLESDGCLALGIAARNFNRAKTPSLSYDNPDNLQQFIASKGNLETRGDVELEQFIPEQPFYHQPVKAAITTPNDLIGITNAQKVLAVDYFDEASQERIAAILSTKTDEKVYDHTKVICDRLTGSTLQGAEIVLIDSLPFVRSVLMREDSTFEYAICFSISKKTDNTASIVSRWSVEEYPNSESGYWNYQIWAEAPHLTQRIVEEILANFRTQYTLTSLEGAKIPQVLVEKGYYDNGTLNLKIYNPIGAKTLIINGNRADSETGTRTNYTKQINLSGNISETVEIFVGTLFDLGFTIKTEKSNDFDALYFADGAWGLEYDKTKTKIEKYVVSTEIPTLENNIFTVERNPILRGQTSDYISLFRSLRPSGVAADLSKYTTVSFAGQGSGVVEVTLVKESIKDWSKQYRTEVSLFDEKLNYDLLFSNFSNGSSEIFKANDITHIVFTAKNGITEVKTIELGVENVQFNTKKAANIGTGEALTAYPNPAQQKTEIAFNLPERTKAFVTLSNLQGKVMFENQTEFTKGNNRMPLDLTGMPSGLYIATVMTGKSKMITKIFVQ